MRIKTIIVEDEINARKALINMLSFYCKEVEVIGEAESVKGAIELITNKPPDLVLLDVRLPDGNGFDIMEKLKNKDFKLVFITAYNEYALRAIKLSALDYLLKPVKPDELRKAIAKVREIYENEELIKLQIETCVDNVKASGQNKKIILNTIDRIFVVEIENLVRCEASENYTNVFIKGKDKIMVARTLKDFEEMLTIYGFFRIHQSHLINLNYVDIYDKKGGGMLLLKNGERVPVSTRRKEGFLKALRAAL